jgi:putative membrane protein
MFETFIAHGGPGFPGAIAFFVLIPLFWLGLAALLVGLTRRRWRRGGGHPAFAGPRGAQATLAERFAQGDIDEQEYRARLEVLRAQEPDRR